MAADSLARAGVIRSARLLSRVRIIRRDDRDIKAGHVHASPQRGLGHVLDAHSRRQGNRARRDDSGRLLARQIEPLFATKLGQPTDSFAPPRATPRCFISSTSRRRRSRATLSRHVHLSPTARRARAAVDAMVKRFEQVWKPEWTARLDTIRLSRNDVMALASIVEKEARLPEERPVIAAVYLNRLRDRHAAPGRSDGAVRARQARRARVTTRISRSSRRTTRTSTRACRRARSRRPGARASRRRCIRRTCRTSISSRSPTATTSFAATSRATRSARRLARRAWDSLTTTTKHDSGCGGHGSPPRLARCPRVDDVSPEALRLIAITDNLRDGIDGLLVGRGQRVAAGRR